MFYDLTNVRCSPKQSTDTCAKKIKSRSSGQVTNTLYQSNLPSSLLTALPGNPQGALLKYYKSLIRDATRTNEIYSQYRHETASEYLPHRAPVSQASWELQAGLVNQFRNQFALAGPPARAHGEDISEERAATAVLALPVESACSSEKSLHRQGVFHRRFGDMSVGRTDNGGRVATREMSAYWWGISITRLPDCTSRTLFNCARAPECTFSCPTGLSDFKWHATACWMKSAAVYRWVVTHSRRRKGRCWTVCTTLITCQKVIFI